MYLRLAPYAVIGLLLIGLLWYRGNAIDAEAEAARFQVERDTAIAANKSLDAALARERAQNAENDRLLGELFDEIAKINRGVADAAADIEGLKDANEDVRAYLSGAVPDALRLQLDR